MRPAGRFQLARLDAFSAEADLGWMTADEATRLAGMHSPRMTRFSRLRFNVSNR